ncbi:SOS response-associated peptidase family protein [bacterium]|nr:SOS response-associated peptidase family protein [bacterium]
MNERTSHEAIVVRAFSAAGGRVLRAARWGLIPCFYASRSQQPQPTNARAESVARLNVFRDAFAARRCLIPGTGFFEWTRVAPKVRYKLTLTGGEGCAFAGLWDEWQAGDEPTVLSATMVTTSRSNLTSPPDVAVEERHGRFDSGLLDGDHGGRLPSRDRTPAKPRQRPQPLADRDRHQLARRRPPEAELQLPDPPVDRGPRPPQCNHPGANGIEGERPELPGRGVAVEFPGDPDRGHEPRQRGRRRAVRVAVVHLGARPEGEEDLVHRHVLCASGGDPDGRRESGWRGGEFGDEPGVLGPALSRIVDTQVHDATPAGTVGEADVGLVGGLVVEVRWDCVRSTRHGVTGVSA